MTLVVNDRTLRQRSLMDGARAPHGRRDGNSARNAEFMSCFRRFGFVVERAENSNKSLKLNCHRFMFYVVKKFGRSGIIVFFVHLFSLIGLRG